MVFVCKLEQKERLVRFIDQKIKDRRLNINATKSFLSYFKTENSSTKCEMVTDGLDKKLNRNYVDYLGLEFNGNNILLRKNTIQKLKVKQNKKVKRQVFNTTRQKRRKPRMTKDIAVRHGNYLTRAAQVIAESAIGKQVARFARKRNLVRRRALVTAGNETTSTP